MSLSKEELEKKPLRELGHMLSEGFKGEEYKLILEVYTKRMG